jgi:flagellar biosynthesis protein FlhF
MRIKTFYAKTMSEALQEIKTSLGADALILSTKEIPRRSGVWGKSSGFEVVAASDHAEEVDVYVSGVEKEHGAALIRSGDTDTDASIADGIVNTYSPSTLPNGQFPAAAKYEARLQEGFSLPGGEAETIPARDIPFRGRISFGLYQELVQSGVEEALARELLTKALSQLAPGQRCSRTTLLRGLGREVLSLVSIPSSQVDMPGKQVVAFFGPTGAGKSTSIAKLAARLALQKRKKVILMTLDGYRIGAVEQMRSYAGLMGIPFRFVEDASELPRAIEENSRRDCILIDTAGRSPRDMKGMQSLADFLRKSESVERHLVLSATMKISDMRHAMDQFEICRPDHLLFTKLDETLTPGPILNELVRTQKSFTYYTDGQRVPDDLHLVPREGILDIVLQREDTATKG